MRVHQVKRTNGGLGSVLLDNCVKSVNHNSSVVTSSWEAAKGYQRRHRQHHEFDNRKEGTIAHSVMRWCYGCSRLRGWCFVESIETAQNVLKIS